MTDMTDIRIVLVNTSHPGNIGAAARAMKTMGLSELFLVSPLCFPDRRADEMASGATDILKNAVVTDSLTDAIADCTLVAGTSARSRTIPWPVAAPREFAEQCREAAAQGHKIAVLFGREQSGLTNEELHRCHLHVQIPAVSGYSSLNLAAAVQILAYELRVAFLDGEHDASQSEWDYPPATSEAMERFYDHLETVLIKTGFLNPKAPRQLMTRLRRLFHRVHPDTMELNMLRGLLASVDDLAAKS